MFKYTVRVAIAIAGMALLSGAQPQANKAQKPAPCTDIAATFEIVNGFDENGNYVPSRILGDGQGTYVAGVSKVSANLFVCGTGDATLNLLSASRKLTLDFGDDLYSNSATPAWITGSPAPIFSVPAFINLKELAVGYKTDGSGTYNQFTSNSFETRLYSYFYYGKGFSNQYYLRANGGIADPEINVPYTTSRIQVNHYPVTDLEGERWEVYPLPDTGGYHVATLSASTNLGQFNMPFYFIIRRK